ncbi:hypothetical protein F5148DRAFT_1290478 [Russula earlei]|uniref:Uncharacterized protein n=1 Tax=Russula earlei TaxID=71964 RepID=A0ACC0TVM3_9AGAM|nr:hypothetical protein F5148DRAFT_1290478 [Russula earlei]
MVKELEVVKELGYSKQLTFAYLTCERLYPNYVYFSKHFHFGEPGTLRIIIDFIYEVLLSNPYNQDQIQKYLAELEPNFPAPENFNTILASSSLDVCMAIAETLNFIADKKFQRILDISTFATDSVDMYVQELENLDYNLDPDFEVKIQSHLLMQQELKVQAGIISYLSTLDTIDKEDINTLVELQQSNKGNLHLKN